MPDGITPLFGLSQRLPPSNIPAEQALLGAILANNKAYEMVSEFLLPVHFADAVNSKIFQTMSSIIDGGGLADGVTLKSKFEGAGILDEVGGTAYLATLMTAMVGIINAREYGKAIHDTWIRRQLISIGEEAVNIAFHSSNELEAVDMLDQVAESISEISVSGTRKSKPMTVKEAGGRAIREGEAAARGDTVAAVSTGIPSVDSAILGLRAGHLIVCGGRPGMGKTAMARSIAINVAIGFGLSQAGTLTDNPDHARPVAYFSLEETSVDFGAAAIAQIAAVPMHVVLTGDWTVQQADAIVSAHRKFESAPLEIFDRPRQGIRDIARDARAFRRRYKSISLLVVDYLQLMPDPSGIKDHRLAVGQNAYGLKDLAKELQCPVLLLSQLGRQVEDRPDHRPTMRDLRETGEIEDAADVVMFPFREAVYFAQTRPKFNPGDSWSEHQIRLQDWSTKMTEIETKAELIVPKVRRGAAPVHRDLHFNPQKTRFEEVIP